MKLRIALFALLALLGSSAHAYTASTTYGVTTGSTTSGFTRTGYGSGAAACASISSVEGVRYWNGAPNGSYSWSLTSSSGGICLGTGVQPPYPPNTAAQGGTWSSAGPGCPGGGTLSGSTCTCTGTDVDTGSACVAATCPASGASAGTHNITTGWALSPTPDANDVVVDTSPGMAYSSHCVDMGGSTGLCSVSPDLAESQPVTDCWRSQTASSQGLYRLSCDFKMKSNSAAACTADTSKPSDPASTPADCPSGSTGTVNGKVVCLGTMPVSGGINFGDPTEAAGNPRAGTSPSQTNAVREPSSGSGGGADARGGPGVTTGPGGTIGTGSDRSGTAPSGEGIEIPTDYQRDTTGAATNSKLDTIIADGLKIKETGVPTEGPLTAEKDALEAAHDARMEGIDTVTSSTGKNTSWTWSMSLPSTCVPLNVDMRYGSIGQVVTLDPCAWQDTIHELMSMVWASTGLFMIFGMVGRTLREV